MKTIPITKNKYVIVDDEDFEYLNQWKWHLSDSGYAVRGINKNNKKFRMHREINKTPEGLDTDHINGNKLDNRKSNLRTVTRSQNKMNVGKPKTNSSGIKGVSWHKACEKWRADIKVNQKQISLGCYSLLQKAILVRNLAEKKYFKEFGWQ